MNSRSLVIIMTINSLFVIVTNISNTVLNRTRDSLSVEISIVTLSLARSANLTRSECVPKISLWMLIDRNYSNIVLSIFIVIDIHNYPFKSPCSSAYTFPWSKH